MTPRLAVKVDVDTLRGYVTGMPRLLGLFEKHGIRASIFFSFGPDNSGKAIRRIFRRGFLSKMVRTRAPSTYGFKTLLYGTLLPAPMIVDANPDILRRSCMEGHDCGIHAWDHVLVQDKLHAMAEDDFEALYRKAAAKYEKILGVRPTSYAAPGWQASRASLATEERLGLKYASDTRGHSPFLPVMGDFHCAVPQIPTTLPTMDELWGLPGITEETLPDIWMKGLQNEWNVLTVHAEMEGISQLGCFEKFLETAKARGVTFLTLEEIAGLAILDRHEIVQATLPGRAGTLAVQGNPV
ncbi:4-deoxy-4-formamido-L-arabinose-phosphoundecaprenol deformylase [Synergistaceae bacterium OttesenSCG-928-I11]|nr:4-deoxy-4-formamido-L-arabinose-phosphoundecaprenol deformylase [Synergistaceae bacterium OttesenSCG-928-I11]